MKRMAASTPSPASPKILSCAPPTIFKTLCMALSSKKWCIIQAPQAITTSISVKKMKRGGSAHLVVPSFLAYGVAGDGRRIRGKVSLAMTIEVVDIERNKN